MFRISNGMDWPIVDVKTVDEIRCAIRAEKPGYYHIDEIVRYPLPAGYSSRRWGIGIKRPDGSVTIAPDPTEAERCAQDNPKRDSRPRTST
jgi:hypothetical protein